MVDNGKLYTYDKGETCSIVSQSSNGLYAVVRWLRTGTLRTVSTSRLKECLGQ